MKKILLFCTSSASIITFRKTFIEKLQKENYQVTAVAFDNERKEDVEKLGVEFICLEDQNRSVNPLRILSLKKRYKRLIKQIAPDVVFTFMLKPNTFGVFAAKSMKVPKIFSMVEGAGDVFINQSLKWKIIRFVVCGLYKKALKNCKKVFFLNQDDRAEFIKRKLVKKEQCELVHGIGMDLEHFAYKPLVNERNFLMIARMLKTKGVMEYCEAARIVKKTYPDASFDYLGGEGTITVSDIQEYIDDGSLNYLGTTSDVRPYLEACTAYVLPSYREGMSVSIMEAECVGRAIITSNVPGCRESIEEGVNGVFATTPQEIAKQAIWLIENPKKAREMGENSRKFAEKHLDKHKINERVVRIIEQ